MDTSQSISIEYTETIQARTHSHELFMLEQPSSGSTSRIRPSWPRCRSRLSLLLVSLSEHTSCYHAQPSILLFISVGWVSHLMPSLLSGWLLTNVQVNNITMLHNTHGHTYIQHIGITILLFFSYSVSTYCPQTIVVYSLVYPAYTASCTHNRPSPRQNSSHSAPIDIILFAW